MGLDGNDFQFWFNIFMLAAIIGGAIVLSIPLTVPSDFQYDHTTSVSRFDTLGDLFHLTLDMSVEHGMWASAGFCAVLFMLFVCLANTAISVGEYVYYFIHDWWTYTARAKSCNVRNKEATEVVHNGKKESH